MKTMTCKQLGGACDEVFSANTFDEIAQLSRDHSMAKFEENDESHLRAKAEMMKMMQEPRAMQAWFEARRAEFDSIPPE